MLLNMSPTLLTTQVNSPNENMLTMLLNSPALLTTQVNLPIHFPMLNPPKSS
jgi:hypothetical protein